MYRSGHVPARRGRGAGRGGGGGNPIDCGPSIGRLACAQQLEAARVRKSNQDAGINNYVP